MKDILTIAVSDVAFVALTALVLRLTTPVFARFLKAPTEQVRATVSGLLGLLIACVAASFVVDVFTVLN